MKVPLHIVKARREKLAELLRQHQYLPLAQVCERLGISEATARRDLAALAEDQAITRTRGGAVYEYNRRFPSFRERLAERPEAKRRLAEAARALIAPGQTVWLDGGTTLHALAQALVERPIEGLTIVTNNLPAAELLSDHEAAAVHLLGGQYYHRSSILLGGKAMASLRAWRFELAFLGAEGLTREGLWNSVDDVAAMERAVAQIAERTVVCLDATKVGRKAPAFLLPVADVDHVLTDASPEVLAGAGVRLPRKRLIAA